jgi:cytochrome c556
MNHKLYTTALTLAVCAGYSLPAFSQAKPETLVKQRQSAMALQGKYFNGQLRPMAQGKMPYDPKIVARNVVFLDALARMPWDGFTPATKDVKSAAAPAVFAEPAKFKEAQDAFMGEVTKLSELSRKGGDENAMKAQILAVDKSCNACHDNFRERQ